MNKSTVTRKRGNTLWVVSQWYELRSDRRTDRAESMMMPFYRHDLGWFMAQIYLADKITKTDATARELIKHTSIHNYSIQGYRKGWLSEPRLPTISPIVRLIKEMLVYGRKAEEGWGFRNRYGVLEHVVTFKHLRSMWPIVTAYRADLSTFHHKNINRGINRRERCVNT